MTDITSTQANSPATAAPKAVRSDSDRPSAPRSRQRSTGGARLKLQVFGEIQGCHMYWCNDDDNAIEQLLSEGFRFVEPSEVQMAAWIVQDADVANRVSRYVGKKADGSAMRAFLLACSNDIWDELQAAGQDQANQWDGAILAGAVGNVDGRYKPKGAETALSRHNQR